MKHKEIIMKNMTNTFIPNPLTKHRDFVSKKFMIVDHENIALCDSYIVEFIHYATENYYERGSYASTYCNNIKFLSMC